MHRGRIAAGVVFAIVGGVTSVASFAADSAPSTEKISKEAQETIEATRQYTAQQKEAFQRQITGLRGKITDASESARTELQSAINELEKKKDGAKEKLDELRSATDTKWHEVREGMNTALNELKHSYQKLQSHMP